MAEEESHDWAKSRSPGVAFEPDLAARRLTVTAVRPQCDVDFSSVPEGWHVTLAARAPGTRVRVNLGHQDKGVEWSFEVHAGGHVSLPRTMQNVTVRAQGLQQPVGLRLERESPLLKLGPGVYGVTAGASGDSEYSVRAEAAPDEKRKLLVLSGPGRCARVETATLTSLRLETTAENLEVFAPGTELETC